MKLLEFKVYINIYDFKRLHIIDLKEYKFKNKENRKINFKEYIRLRNLVALKRMNFNLIWKII